MKSVLPDGMSATWRSGDFTGANRPIARVTLQQSNVALYNFELATNAGSPSTPSGTGVGDLEGFGSTMSTFLTPLGGDGQASPSTPDTTSGGIVVDYGNDNGITGDAGVSTGVVASPGTQAAQSTGTVHQTYASIIFGATALPKELPNVASVSWSRSTDQDFATCTFKFYNTKPMPVGTVPTRDLDMPGYYTYNRGASSFSNRWGQTPNEWSNLLMPDNILRSYEGYGFDPFVVPEQDSHLVQTGMWRIDKVEYDALGVITVTARDVGSILGDEIIFVPVVPPDFYPVSFAASPAHVGVVGPAAYTYTQDAAGGTDPQHPAPKSWHGPLTAPSGLTGIELTPGSKSMGVTWDAIDTSGFAVAGPTTIGYVIRGYRLVVDGVVLPTITPNVDGTVVYTANVPTHELVNGNVYDIQVVAIYKEKFTREGELHFKTNVAQEQEGAFSTAVFGRPGVLTAPTVTPNSISTDLNAAGTLDPNRVAFAYTLGAATMTWTCLVYQVDGGEQHIYTTTTTASSGAADFNVGVDIVDQTKWNFLIYGSHAGATGPGDLHFAATHGAFHGAPVDGAAPHDPGPAPTGPVIKNRGGKGNSPLSGNEIKIKYSASSNDFPLIHTVVSGDTLWDLAQHYFGDATKWPAILQLNHDLIERVAKAHGFANAGSGHWIFPGEKLKVSSSFGHTPQDAFDKQVASYWLSDGHARPDGGADFEWIEGSLDRVTLTQVSFNTVKAGYHCYVSVFAKGKWIKHDSDDTIPYDPADPADNNHARIAFCAQTNIINTDGAQHDNDGTTVTFKTPIPGATKVRLTFHNLQHFSEGDGSYRVGVQSVTAHGSNGTGSSGGGGTTTKTPAPVVAGPPQDDNDPDIVKSWTEYIPAHFDVGAGANPGAYNDYCVDEQTEALTRRGWLRWDEIQPGDKALGMNPVTGLMEWQSVKDVYREHRQRKMVSMESQLHSSLTTPDHKWVVTRQDGSVTWVTTDTLKTGQRIPLAAPVVAPSEAMYADAFVELVAWFWTEGWVSGNACIAQSETANPVYTTRIRNTLTELYGRPGRMLRGIGAMWNETRRKDGVVTFRLSKPVKDALLAVAPDKVVSTDFLCSLTGPQRTSFVERSLDADGWRTTGGRVGLAQRDERRAKAFEIACLLDGRSVRTRCDWNGMWSVNLLRSRFTLPQSAVVTEVDYDGVVWCPTLEHHNWVARRNGSIYVTGNTDIVKLFVAWGGFFWPEHAQTVESDGSLVQYNFGTDEFGLSNIDPVLGNDGSGRAWGDFEQTGTAGPAAITVDNWDKKSLMDGISYVRDIIGFVFYIDEQGGVVWRNPNVYSVGNWLTSYDDDGPRTSTIIEIDEDQTLIALTATLDSTAVRERIFVASVDGSKGALAAGWNPNPTGLRRIAGWTDMHFQSSAECQVMADLIALRQLFLYRTDTLTIPAYPAIQVDDQVRIFEQVTGEGYLHYVKGISSTNNMEGGSWTYQLTTNWLGENPGDLWAFDIAALATETQAYLTAMTIPAGAALESDV